MVPRTEVVGLYEDEPFETHIKVIAQEKSIRDILYLVKIKMKLLGWLM